MLQLQVIREEKENIIQALKKRNVEGTPLLENVLQLDEKRRATQTLLDSTLAEANKISKEIGILFKTGKVEEANLLKEKTGALKDDSKRLGDELTAIAEELQEALYLIPNIPNDLVPSGNTDEDN